MLVTRRTTIVGPCLLEVHAAASCLLYVTGAVQAKLLELYPTRSESSLFSLLSINLPCIPQNNCYNQSLRRSCSMAKL